MKIARQKSKKMYFGKNKAYMRYPISQRGLTLIELLVAMLIGLMITLAAVASLIVSRQGFTNVDASSQLRDNSRFLQDIIQRIGVQAGFKNVILFPSVTAMTIGLSDPLPNVFGINNASRTESKTWNEGTSRTSGSVGYGSDILVLRAQNSTFDAFSKISDRSMIDCSGVAPKQRPIDANDNVYLTSIFHVGIGSDGEPALLCSRSDTGDANYDAQPLISGVENFQVLYGVDGIKPENTTVPLPDSSADSVPERYMRADQLTVIGNDKATYANWQRVRSIRIGLVLRGRPNSLIDNTSETYYPLGKAFADAKKDPGTVFTTTADGRMRQTITFTVHLRNYQGAN